MNIELLNEWMRRDEVRRVYPRQVGLKRRVVYDDDGLMNYIVSNSGVDCYCSIFSEHQVRNEIVDTIYLDVDCHEAVDFNKIFDEVFDRVSCILRRIGCPSRAYWSGRGVAMFYDFRMSRITDYRSRVLMFLNKYNVINLIDKVVCGDIKRLARLPDTINSKSKFKVVKLDVYNLLDKRAVKEQIISGKHCDSEAEKRNWVLSELERIDVNEIRSKEVDKVVEGVNVLPNCIRQGVVWLIETGELEHMWRVVISLYLLKVWGYERTYKLFSEFAKDFDAKKTEYQLKFLMRKGYKCYSCSKLKMMGICCYENQRECAFYVITDGWLEKVIANEVACK